jgi:hypothetical protein
MTAQPTPAVVHSDRTWARPVPRDVPVDDFVAMMAASGVNADFLSSIRRDW